MPRSVPRGTSPPPAAAVEVGLQLEKARSGSPAAPAAERSARGDFGDADLHSWANFKGFTWAKRAVVL